MGFIRVSKKRFKGHAKNYWVGDFVVFDESMGKWRKALWSDYFYQEEKQQIVGYVGELVKRDKKVLIVSKYF